MCDLPHKYLSQEKEIYFPPFPPLLCFLLLSLSHSRFSLSWNSVTGNMMVSVLGLTSLLSLLVIQTFILVKLLVQMPTDKGESVCVSTLVL